MAFVLAPNALVNLATIKVENAIVVTTFDDPLTRMINGASDAIAQYCNRELHLALWVEPFGIPGTNRARIVSERDPILVSPFAPNPSITTNNDPGPAQTLVYGTDFYMENQSAGLFFRQYRWTPSGLHREGIAQDWDPDAIEAQNILTYVAGYRTQPQVDAAAAWPGAGLGVVLLQLVTPAAHATQVWQATVAGLTGGVEPTWGNNPAIGSTVTDGAVTWVFLGTQSQARTLPYDIEQACIDTVTTWYQRRGERLELTSERLGDAQRTFLSERPALPNSAKEALNQYRRTLIE